MDNCYPEKTWGWHCFSRGDNSQCYPIFQSIIIILSWMLIKYIVSITFGFKTILVKWIFWVCISYYVKSNALTTPVRIYGEPYAHKFCTVDIFWNITRRQAISPVANSHHVLGRGFMIQHDSWFDFYQMSLSQSESTILHESIIFINILNQLYTCL